MAQATTSTIMNRRPPIAASVVDVVGTDLLATPVARFAHAMPDSDPDLDAAPEASPQVETQPNVALQALEVTEGRGRGRASNRFRPPTTAAVYHARPA
jgi:hypothetical protein